VPQFTVDISLIVLINLTVDIGLIVIVEVTVDNSLDARVRALLECWQSLKPLFGATNAPDHRCTMQLKHYGLSPVLVK